MTIFEPFAESKRLQTDRINLLDKAIDIISNIVDVDIYHLDKSVVENLRLVRNIVTDVKETL
mgnify:CR=1 FL=1